MKIDGINISKYGAKQWRVAFDQADISSETEWPKGSILPFFEENMHTFKGITITLLVYGNGREHIRNRISDIVALCLNESDLELDGYLRKFKGVLKKSSVKEGSDQARKRYQTLDLEFDAYEYGKMVTESGTGVTEITVNNPGNIESPAAVLITPLIGMAELTISGISRSIRGEDLPVTIKNLTTEKTVTLDGIEGLIEEDGQLKDAEIWALPSMLPGENKITISSNRTKIEVKVLPLYI